MLTAQQCGQVPNEGEINTLFVHRSQSTGTPRGVRSATHRANRPEKTRNVHDQTQKHPSTSNCHYGNACTLSSRGPHLHTRTRSGRGGDFRNPGNLSYLSARRTNGNDSWLRHRLLPNCWIQRLRNPNTRDWYRNEPSRCLTRAVRVCGLIWQQG